MNIRHQDFIIPYSLLIFVLLLMGCGGCGGVKKTDISTNSTTSSVNSKSSKLNSKQLDSIHQAAQVKLPITTIIGDWNNKNVDEYNVYKQILVFKNSKTKEVIKTIDVVKENPFHQLGFERRKEPAPDAFYFLRKKGAENKHELKEYLPKEIFNEIKEDFYFDRAIAEVNTRTTDNRYATINYQLDWLPDAYSDQGEWNGPGYGTHYIVVYDSLGNKIFNKLFGGNSDGFSVSEDGKYLFNMICLSPEWDENIRYKFTVINIKTKKVVYEELIENCKLNGGGGDFFKNFYHSNGNYVELQNNYVLGFTYINSNFFKYEDKLKFEIKTKSKNELQLIFPDGKKTVVKIDSLYTKIKLD